MEAASLTAPEIDAMSPDRLVVYLVRRDWRQEQIAHEIETSQATICRIHSGKYKTIRYAVIERLRELVKRLQEF